MVKVCDAIMGSGKSSATIAYMNEHKSDKFIYITPYLDEAARIKEACPDLKFVEPSNNIPKYHFKKYLHTIDLIKHGKNIATTHSAFMFYDEEVHQLIKEHQYTLFIDESLSTLGKVNVSKNDMDILVRSNDASEHDGVYTLENKGLESDRFRDVVMLMKNRDVTIESDENEESILYWTLPVDMLNSFKDVIIMTYLIQGQDLYYYLTTNNIEFKYIGVMKDEHGYHFDEERCYIPEYVSRIRDLIHICDHKKLNSIGENKRALSMSWMNTHTNERDQLRRNIHNYFQNVIGCRVNNIMWGTYSKYRAAVSGRKNKNWFVMFNERATNKYRDRSVLAYIANVYVSGGVRSFYLRYGVKVDDDTYALATLLQWMWRSAIRDGKEIWIYLPSSRMRGLLEDWMSRVEGTGGKVIEFER